MTYTFDEIITHPVDKSNYTFDEITYTFDEITYSDLYKDAYGSRPRGLAREAFINGNDDEKQRLWDSARNALELEMEWERIQTAKAINYFEDWIAEMLGIGASDRETAIRWIRDSFGDDLVSEDIRHFEYRMGLPFGYIVKES